MKKAASLAALKDNEELLSMFILIIDHTLLISILGFIASALFCRHVPNYTDTNPLYDKILFA